MDRAVDTSATYQGVVGRRDDDLCVGSDNVAAHYLEFHRPKSPS
jgi:hypothetical protein